MSHLDVIFRGDLSPLPDCVPVTIALTNTDDTLDNLHVTCELSLVCQNISAKFTLAFNYVYLNGKLLVVR